MKKKTCIVTYSHKNCQDLWPVYFSLLKKYTNNMDSFWMCNGEILYGDGKNNICIPYDENDSFSVQWLKTLEILKTKGYEHFIYSQEDFLLYDHVNMGAIDEAIHKITLGETDFVKLIKSGDSEYCMQAAVHNIDKFLSFYKKYQIDSIRQEGFLRTSSINEYESKWLPKEWVGNKRGMYHWDSKVWPYIATALVKGQWNLSEYRKELRYLQRVYNIDFSIRGIQ